MSISANKFLDRMFRKVQGLVWDLTTGQVGLKDTNGIYTLIQDGEGDTAAYGVSVNPFDSLGTALPAFATQTPIEQVDLGDIIVGEREILGWVIEKRDRSLKLLDKNGMTKNYTPPKVAIVGANGVLVVKNLFNLAGGQQGMLGLQNNLLPLLALGDDGSLDKLMPLILMQTMTQQPGAAAAPAANGFASMLPLLLLSKGGKGGLGDIDPMMLMMMSGGGAGMNPMMLLALQGGLGGDEPKVSSGTTTGGVPALTRVTRA